MGCPTPIRIKDPSKRGLFLDVPCGRCGTCLELRRTYWTFRMHEELRNHDSAAFITLTYTEPPLSPQNLATLEKKHLQDFIKRLRHHLHGRKIRYYAVGEYGPETQRPHYHAIIFSLDRTEIQYVREAWDYHQAKDYLPGFSTVAPVTPGRIHYVTKYHLNYVPKSDRPTTRQDEFALMSRNPGIGASYLERAKQYHEKTENQYVILDGHKLPLPRYYYDKIWKDEYTRLRIAADKQAAAEKVLQQNISTLKSMGYENPETEMFLRQIEKGAKYKRKRDLGRGL